NAADFGDLLLECIRLFREHPTVLAQFQRRFKFILVDEYQDTNVAQYLWLRLLSQAPSFTSPPRGEGAAPSAPLDQDSDDDPFVAFEKDRSPHPEEAPTGPAEGRPDDRFRAASKDEAADDAGLADSFDASPKAITDNIDPFASAVIPGRREAADPESGDSSKAHLDSGFAPSARP